MSTQITFLEAKDKIEEETGTQGENFVSETEMFAFFNSAVDAAKAEIQKLGLWDEYFLTNANITTIIDQAEYDLPSNIYATKIKGITFDDGSNDYIIRRLKNRQRFLRKRQIERDDKTADYKYFITNESTAVGKKIVLIPPAREASATNIEIWYTRDSEKLKKDSDIIDIPEFIDFIYEFVKKSIKEKEIFPQSLGPQDLIQFNYQRKLMIDTLTEMIEDNDTILEPDFTHYQDSAIWWIE